MNDATMTNLDKAQQIIAALDRGIAYSGDCQCFEGYADHTGRWIDAFKCVKCELAEARKLMFSELLKQQLVNP